MQGSRHGSFLTSFPSHSRPGLPHSQHLERPQASLEVAARQLGSGSFHPDRAGAGGRVPLPQFPRDAQHVLAAQLDGAGHCPALLLPGGKPSWIPQPLWHPEFSALTFSSHSGRRDLERSCFPGLPPGSGHSTSPSMFSSAPLSSCCPWLPVPQESMRSFSSACESQGWGLGRSLTRMGGLGKSPQRDGGGSGCGFGLDLGVTSTEQRELSTSSGVWLPAHFPARFGEGFGKIQNIPSLSSPLQEEWNHAVQAPAG